jgi:hypothetical protein
LTSNTLYHFRLKSQDAAGNASVTADNTMRTSSPVSGGASPSGWLYTSGNKIFVSDGNGGGTQWMGRGVNMDDIFLCGYNNSLWMTNSEQTLTSIASGLMSSWKPNFVRVSLGMNSYDPASWTANASQYKTPMTNVINSIGAHPNTYVLVSLRSDASMGAGVDEATNYPIAATDATYVALVDSFANSNFVMFGLSNEPGGMSLSSSALSSAMNHAVGVIRAEEDRLGVPHHVISVQGNQWTSDISFYAKTPLPYDNIVYEVHRYQPATSEYTFSNIPVILGEYGSLTSSSAPSFFADLESKQISSLAWDFEPYSNCSPDLLSVNHSATNLLPTTWGTLVQNYLLSHTP